MGSPQDALMESFSEFVSESYTKYVIIDGYEPKSACIVIDYAAELADYQFIYWDEDYNQVEVLTEESRDCYNLLFEACQSLLPDFVMGVEEDFYVLRGLMGSFEEFFKQQFDQEFETDFFFVMMDLSLYESIPVDKID